MIAIRRETSRRVVTSAKTYRIYDQMRERERETQEKDYTKHIQKVFYSEEIFRQKKGIIKVKETQKKKVGNRVRHYHIGYRKNGFTWPPLKNKGGNYEKEEKEKGMHQQSSPTDLIVHPFIFIAYRPGGTYHGNFLFPGLGNGNFTMKKLQLK